MNLRSTLLALVAVSSLGAAPAAADGLIGVYFITPTTDYACWDCIATGQIVDAYLIISQLSEPAIGMDCRIIEDLAPSVVRAGVEGPPGIVFIVPPGSEGNFYIGFSSPTSTDMTVCAHLTYLFLGTGLSQWFIGPAEYSSLPGTPSFATAADPDTHLPLYTSGGDFSVPVAWIDTMCDTCFPLPAETSTWGAVKGLFR